MELHPICHLMCWLNYLAAAYWGAQNLLILYDWTEYDVQRSYVDWWLAVCLIGNSSGDSSEEYIWYGKRSEVAKCNEVDSVSDGSLCCWCIARNERSIRSGTHVRWSGLLVYCLRAAVHISTGASETWLCRGLYRCGRETGNGIILLWSVPAWFHTPWGVSEAPSVAYY